jgi:hypothetical protein
VLDPHRAPSPLEALGFCVYTCISSDRAVAAIAPLIAEVLRDPKSFGRQDQN